MDTATPSEIGLNEFVAVSDLVGGAFDQCLAFNEDVDAIADLEDETHVVVNEEHSEAAIAQFADPIGELPDFTLVQASRGLIEQDVRRIAGQRSCDAHEALNTVWKGSSSMRSTPPKSEGIEKTLRSCQCRPVRLASAHCRHDDVLANGQTAEEVAMLKGSRQTIAGPNVRLRLRDVNTVEHDMP